MGGVGDRSCMNVRLDHLQSPNGTYGELRYRRAEFAFGNYWTVQRYHGGVEICVVPPSPPIGANSLNVGGVERGTCNLTFGWS